MPPLFDLEIAALEGSVHHGPSQGLVASGTDGHFGVLARHAPMVAELTTGVLTTVGEDGRRRPFAVSGGVLEVTWEGVAVLADAAEAADEIDVGRAEAAWERAEHRLHGEWGRVDSARAQAALVRAMNRLRVADRWRERR